MNGFGKTRVDFGTSRSKQEMTCSVVLKWAQIRKNTFFINFIQRTKKYLDSRFQITTVLYSQLEDIQFTYVSPERL